MTRIDEVVSTDLVVRLSDLDYNLHMNNSYYLQAFELARFALLFRCGSLYKKIFREGWSPIVASSHVIFRSPLHFREPYTVHSWVDGWDEKWLWISQCIISKTTNKVAALCLCKGTIRRGSEILTVRHIASLLPGGGAHEAQLDPDTLPERRVPSSVAALLHAENDWRAEVISRLDKLSEGDRGAQAEVGGVEG